jgi:hypothetical protein
MVNYDPIDHYCFLIQEAINEGGSKIKEPHAGITSDMSGRWTIKAFDTDKHNKKETPEMKEAKKKALTDSNPDNDWTKEQQEAMKKFGFEWKNYVGRGGARGGWEQYYKGTNRSGEDSHTAEVYIDPRDKKIVLFVTYHEGGWREEEAEVWYHYNTFEELERMLPKIFPNIRGAKVTEAIYANNAGIMEVFKFFEKATDAEKQQFDNLVNAGNQNAALKLVEKVLGVKFQGDLTLQ